MSDVAARLFHILAQELGHPMLLCQEEFHRLAADAELHTLFPEVSEKLDLLVQSGRTGFLRASLSGH